MGLRLNTNVSSLQAQRSVKQVGEELESNSKKLSSGQRINSAADDAAGLSISEKLKADVRSSRQATRNANDGVSMVQVAEGALSESSNILNRMRELSIQMANDTMTNEDRDKANLEYLGLREDLDRIAGSTEYNGNKLIDGSGRNLEIQIGIDNNQNYDRLTLKQLNAGAGSLGVDTVSVGTKLAAQESLGRIDSAIEKINSQRSVLGAIQNNLNTSASFMGMYSDQLSETNTKIRDTDYAVETANQAKNSILMSAGTATLAQANISGQSALKLLG
ncbi:MAG: flagellin [Bacteriovoracaceae bacterium]